MNVGFVSTRFAGTDGVSLEATKWAQVLEELGHDCYWFAGKLDRTPERSHLAPRAFFDHPDVHDLHSRLFGTIDAAPGTEEQIDTLRAELRGELEAFVDHFDVDLLIPQNAFAIPMNVPLGLALLDLIEERGLPAIAHHHDFYWERERFAESCIPRHLARAFPPALDSPTYRNVVINTAARRDLEHRLGLGSQVVPNVLDFDHPPSGFDDDYGADFRQSLGISETATLLLQPSRVVERKGIEHAITLAEELQLRGREVVLVISHEAGDEGYYYLGFLQQRADQAGVRMVLAADRIDEHRSLDPGGRKIYTLWDVYPHADFVTYPSLYEGFGNALLEALWFEKPVMVNRYPVYVEDIAPTGLALVEMDGEVTVQTVAAVETLLDDPDRVADTGRRNLEICRTHFGYQVLRDALEGLLSELP